MPRLDDPKEFQIIKDIYLKDKPLSDEAERQEKKQKKQTNQSR